MSQQSSDHNEGIRTKLDNLTYILLPHQDREEVIKEICDYGVKFVSDESPYVRPVFNEPLMNAYAYATGLNKSAKYLEHRLNTRYEQSFTIFASSLFIQHLALHEFIKEIEKPEQKESMVIYYNRHDYPKHAGIKLKSGKIQSKWGTFPVFEHDLWLIPKSYGDTVKYYSLITTKEAEKCFFDFTDKVRLNPITLESIKQFFRQYFFEGDKLWLFGSRVNMKEKGGDIDLYIESSCTDYALLLNAKRGFTIALWHAIGEQKIDIVIRRNDNDLPIYKVAEETGIRLI